MGKNSNVQHKPIVKEVVEEKIETAVVTDCDKLNLREEPNINSDIVTVMDNGSEVVIEKEDNEWFKVKFNNRLSGYAMSKYLKKN